MRVTVVHTDACHLCDDARQVLAQLATEYPLRIELVDAGSTHGQQLMAVHRAGMYPMVLLEGEFLSAGRLPRGRLRHLLQHLTVQPRAVQPR
jgi:hypothetical protein